MHAIVTEQRKTKHAALQFNISGKRQSIRSEDTLGMCDADAGGDCAAETLLDDLDSSPSCDGDCGEPVLGTPAAPRLDSAPGLRISAPCKASCGD